MCLLLSNGWVCGQRFGFEAFFEACSFFTIEHRRWRVANGDYLAFGRLFLSCTSSCQASVLVRIHDAGLGTRQREFGTCLSLGRESAES